MLVPFPEISSQFSIWIIYIIILNIFQSAQCELLFLKSLCLCKFIAFSGWHNLFAWSYAQSKVPPAQGFAKITYYEDTRVSKFQWNGHNWFPWLRINTCCISTDEQ